MNGQIRAKVTPRFDHDRSRPPSPLKSLPTSPSPTPAPKLKAKLSSSASVVGRNKPVASPSTHNLSTQVSSAVSSARAPPARAPSPFKPIQGRTAPSATSAAQVKAKVTPTVRPNVSTTTSAPSVPELRQRALTDAPGHSRRGSISSSVSAAPSAAASRVYSPPRLAPTSSNEENHSGPSSVVSSGGGGPIKVRSKVTKIAGHGTQPASSVPASPSFPPHTRPNRVPSTSSLTLSPPFGPTKATRSNGLSPTAAPGHGRYPTSQEKPSPKINPFRAFVPFDDSNVTYSRPGSPGRVDPAQIPLPPTSPPMSAVSCSSRSSVSVESRGSDSSGGTAQRRASAHVPSNGIAHARSRSSVDGLGIQYSPLLKSSSEPVGGTTSPEVDSESDEDEDVDEDEEDRESEEDEDKKLRKEAISNRKIADLEITNKSLLAINTQLECVKNKQAREIRELRRKLRESLLVLPPSVYRVAKSSLAAGDPIDEDDAEADAEEEGEEEEEDLETTKTKADEIYNHCRSMLDDLLTMGRKALETTPADFVEPATRVTKVLTEEEARTWRGEDSTTLDGDNADDTATDAATDAATDDDPSRPLSPTRVAVPDDFTSDDETGASLVLDESILNGSPLPPITVTPSPSP